MAFKMEEKSLVKDVNIFIHDATPTWSGFIYQGDVAIYLVLHKICELRDEGLSKEIIKSEYGVEVEKSEDIAIVKINGEHRQYLSIHQVKDWKDKSISKYRNPLIQLMLEKGFWEKKELGNPEAFLHVSNHVKEDNVTIKRKIVSWANCIKEFYDSIKAFAGKSIEDAERDNFYQEIKEKMEKEPIKLARAQYTDLIKKVKKSCDDKKYDMVKDDLKCLVEYLEVQLEIDNIKEKVALYQYDDKNFYCEGIRIFEKITEQVRIYKCNDKNISQGQYEYIADKLLHYMRSHVLQRHHASQRGEDIKAEIIFNDFIDILDSTISEYEREANILALRRGYEEILSQYCRTICGHQCEKTNNFECKLYKREYEKIELEDEAFIRMCFHYNPDCDKRVEERDCLRKLLKEHGMQDSVLEVLKKVPNVNFINENDKTKVIINNHNKNALLTAIEGKRSEVAVENIIRGINSNAELVSPIFEADELITVELSSEESVWDCDYAEIVEEYIGNETMKDSDVNKSSICEPKKPRFVKADEIIENLL